MADGEMQMKANFHAMVEGTDPGMAQAHRIGEEPARQWPGRLDSVVDCADPGMASAQRVEKMPACLLPGCVDPEIADP